ncbi:threonylcarbamoyl-AMP synthase [bacterium]|nr:threonylcarbamoyl-AMP synthase [bacterium]
MSELLEIFPHNIDERKIKEIVERLRQGEIIILPTDTIYALVGDLNHRQVLDNICKLTGIKPNKANLSILCRDLSDLSTYSRPIDNSTYKLMNRLLPGPFTFILNASAAVPKIFRRNKKTIGIRIPQHPIIQKIIEELGNPLISTSIHAEDEIQAYLTEPEEIYQAWNEKVELIVDGGAGSNVGSTVIDATENEIYIVREGQGMELI